ncbi:MAG: hypothetical protein WAT71_02105 [Ignavibacteria bacterium]
MEKEWMTPKAVVISKKNKDLEMGRYGPIWPKTPACYGFTIIANVKPGRADVFREYGEKLANALEPDPITAVRDLDTKYWLKGVRNFNFHMHLPHYAVTGNSDLVHVLAMQQIDMSNPHPFTEAGNLEFNSFIWVKPEGKRAGDVLLADSTIFSTLFGADESLENFWRNIATAKL